MVKKMIDRKKGWEMLTKCPKKTCHLNNQALYKKGAVASALTEITAGKVVNTPLMCDCHVLR